MHEVTSSIFIYYRHACRCSPVRVYSSHESRLDLFFSSIDRGNQRSFSLRLFQLDSPANPKFGNGFLSTRNSGNPGTTLPDIVGEQSLKGENATGFFFSFSIETLREGSSSTSNAKKSTDQGLSVLGYDNVKTVSVQPKVREELDYLDREVRRLCLFLPQPNVRLVCPKGTSASDRFSNRSAEETRHTSERSGKLHRHVTCENSRTMSDDSASRSFILDVVLSLKPPTEPTLTLLHFDSIATVVVVPLPLLLLLSSRLHIALILSLIHAEGKPNDVSF